MNNKDYLLQESPVWKDDKNNDVYQVHLLTNVNHVDENGSPIKCINVCSRSNISYDECYKKILTKILDSVDQFNFTVELEKNIDDGIEI